MIDFSYHEGNSFLHRMDPTIKFIGLILISILILLLKGLSGLSVSLLILALLTISSGLPIKEVISPLKKASGFLVLIFVMNAVFYNAGECLYSAGIICISAAGIMQGFNIVQHTASVLMLSAIFIHTTTSVQIMRGIEALLHPLRRFGVPVRDIALIMSIAMQFIPVFFSDFERIRKAQIARGADFSGNSFTEKIKAISSLAVPAFVSAFRRADELSLAIDARGYRSEKEMSDGNPYGSSRI